MDYQALRHYKDSLSIVADLRVEKNKLPQNKKKPSKKRGINTTRLCRGIKRLDIMLG